MTPYDAYSVSVHVNAHRQQLLAEAASERLARFARLRRKHQPRRSLRRDAEW